MYRFWETRTYFAALAAFLAGILGASSVDAQTFEKLLALETGGAPFAPLIEGPDGSFYGTTGEGGESDTGTLFHLRSDGKLATIASLPAEADSVLVLAPDGNFYGTTLDGIYRIDPSGKGTKVMTLDAPILTPTLRAGVVLGKDGNLYWLTATGGVSGNGRFLRVSLDGEYTELADLSDLLGRVASRFVEDEHGAFYALMLPDHRGGNQDLGKVIRISPEGDVSTVATWNDYRIGQPAGGLIFSRDGNLYGLTSTGGMHGWGCIYRVTMAGEVSIVFSFEELGLDRPQGDLVEGPDGSLFGVSGNSSDGRVFQFRPDGTFQYLTGRAVRDALAVVVARDGDLYITSRNAGPDWRGGIVRVSMEGGVEEVALFQGPQWGITGLLHTNGRFIGTTYPGHPRMGYGSVFRISAEEPVAKTLVRFSGTGPNRPTGGLVVGKDGAYYGTSLYGGKYNGGTLYRITDSGVCSVVHPFYEGIGTSPNGIIKGSDGMYYGLARSGGRYFSGSVFRLSEAEPPRYAAWLTGSNGASGAGHLNETEPGIFFGVAESGGDSLRGTFFRVEVADHSLTALYSFRVETGTRPAKLVRADDGMFYGVARTGGAFELGTVFKISRKGEFTVLAHLDETTGGTPSGGMVVGRDGRLYVETTVGGAHSYGTVFSISRDGGPVRIIHHFDGYTVGRPTGALIRGEDEELYGGTGDSIYRVTLPRVPTAAPPEVKSITRTEAVFEALVNPQSGDTAIVFEIFREGELEQPIATISAGTVPAGQTAVSVVANASGLQMNSAYQVRVVATNPAGVVQGNFARFVTASNLAPYAEQDRGVYNGGSLILEVLANDEDPEGDPLTISAAGHGAFGTVSIQGASLVYMPGFGFAGRDAFSYEVSDGFGGVDTGEVMVITNFAVTAPMAATDVEVPHAGEVGSGVPAGARFKRFGIPSITPDGSDGWLATVKTPGAAFTGIFDSAGARLLLRTGDPVVDESGIALGNLAFRSFRDPVFAGPGQYAVIARVHGKGAGKGNDEGLWMNDGALFRRLAMNGAPAPGLDGAILSRVSSVVATGSGHVAFTGELKRGRGGVTAADDQALWVAMPRQSGVSEVVPVLRSGDDIITPSGGTSRIASFRALLAGQAGAGEGKAGFDRLNILLVIRLADGTEGVASLDGGGEITWLDISGQDAFPVLENAVIESFGTPDSSAGVPGFTSLLKVQDRSGGKKAGRTVVYDSEVGVLAESGGEAPGTDTRFKAFSDPVLSHTGEGVSLSRYGAFIGNLQRSGQTNSNNDTGIWIWSEEPSGAARLLVREGDAAPDSDGAVFARFESLAVLPGRGAIFTATLRSVAKFAKMKGERSRGVWAVNRDGVLTSVLQTGTQLETGGQARILSNFDILTNVPGSVGQQRFFDDQQTLILRAWFVDGTSAVLKVGLP